MPVPRDRRRGAIGGVFLADAAEVDLHAGARKADAALRPLDVTPSDQLAQRVDLGRIGQRAAGRGGNPTRAAARRT